MKMYMSKSVMLFLGLFLTVSTLTAQTAAKPETSDPKAKALLDKVKKLYESYQTLETSFTLSLKMAEQTKEEVQKGKIYQDGTKYRAEVGKTLFISDGTTVWQKDNNTVRIMSASNKKSSELMSPKDLMTIYEKKDYIFALLGQSAEGWSKKANIVTFKPTNRKGDYTQIRVAIDQKTNQVVSITAFGKDQSRYKLSLEQPVPNKKYTADYFTFDKSKFPNVKVEDLRID
jgi:outer membrane lipoprotein carrier protein